MAFAGARYHSTTRDASQTHLPPSPELAATTGVAAPPKFSLFDHSAAGRSPDVDVTGQSYETTVSRLRSAANYSRFDPQVVACSPPNVFLSSDPTDGTSSNTIDTSCSLAAIAGDNGIALFRTSRPDVPLLFLGHCVGRSGAGIKNLAFEPGMEFMYLAASRGNGLLLWDASGHSLSPLLGRLAVENSAVYDDAESNHQNNEILSLSWRTTQPAIIVATRDNACLWDLRCSLGMKGSKPGLRFSSQSTFPLVQVACCHTKEQECATMDSHGVVRVQDLRMTSTGGARRQSSVLGSFHSCRHAGIGLSSFRTNTNESHWMTWGLDAPKADAVVGIWSTSSKATKADTKAETVSDSEPSEDYWHMDGSVEGRMQNKSLKNRNKLSESSMMINQIARFTMPYLACARVCPDPFDNSIVTVGFTNTGGWKAALWKLLDDDEEDEHDNTTSNSEASNTFGVEKIVSFEDERKSKIFSGSKDIGQLIGAELALSQSPIPIGRNQREGKTNNDWELLLCCLTDNGFVTTSAVAEAPSAKMKSSETGPRFISGQKRYYFPNNEQQRWDAAAALVQKATDRAPRSSSLDESRHAFSRDSTKILLASSPEKHMNERDAGVSLPFDMDVGYGPMSSPEPITVRGSSGNTTTSIVDHDVEENAELSFKNVRMLNKRISTDRVPCPVVCGATFNNGVGGLLCFNNGKVSKMWEWYKKTDFRKRSLQSNNSSVGSGFSMYPKFKKDLDDMTKAAKDAQWGEENEGQEEGNNESDGSLDGIFDDLDDLSEGGPDDLDESRHSRFQHNDDVDKSEDIYDMYFGNRNKPLTLPPGTSKLKAKDKLEGEPKILTEVGIAVDPLSSDVLAPIVLIQYDTHSVMFNRQSVELAKHLNLGEWRKTPGPIEEFENTTYHDHERIRLSPTADSFDDVHVENSSRFFASPTVLTRSRSGGEEVECKVSATLSDPNINKFDDSFPPSNMSIISELYNEDETVHGGEYSMRPRTDDSKIILRKILPNAYQNVQSVNPSLPFEDSMNHAAFHGSFFAQDDLNMGRETLQKITTRSRRIGVYTLPVRQSSMRNEEMKSICIYNADICRKFGQIDKSNTWSMIAEALENDFDEELDSFDGWGSGSSFSRELVSNMLKYYESVGDVQMVATIVCVLRPEGEGPEQRNRNETKSEVNSLLPPDQDEKYDLCIRRYGKLVYRWGLLAKRTELHKHLSRHLLRAEGSQFIPSKDGGKDQTGVSFAITCLSCNKENAVSGVGNICSSCGDYAFRCIICDNAVRGMFTICPLCGHGGHMNHMLNWFEDNKMCPSGCGCFCTLSISNPSKTQGATDTKAFPELLV